MGRKLGAVVSVGEAAQVGGEVVAAQLAVEEAVDRLDDGVFAQVEHGWMRDLVLPDVVAGRLSAVVQPVVIQVADHIAVAESADDQSAEQVWTGAATRCPACGAVGCRAS